MSPAENPPPEHDRVLSSKAQFGEAEAEESVRPKQMPEFIGQGLVKKRLRIGIAAATRRNRPLDHALLHGPPGLGKTTLAHFIAHELNVGLRQTTGPALDRVGDLAAILTSLNPLDVLFIDEIHRLKPIVEETLYSAMEDFRIDIVIGEGPGAKAMQLRVHPFTLIGATTRAGMVAALLRDRFGIKERLDLYTHEDLQRIAERSAGILQIPCTEGGARTLAGRSRGTPRVVNRLLRRTRDYAEVEADGQITARVADRALALHNVYENGLDEMDHRLLRILIERFQGGPAGVEALAAGLNEDRGTVEDVYEPFLLQAGYLLRTARGRVAGPKAYEALGIQAS